MERANGAGKPDVHCMEPMGFEEVSKSSICVGCGLKVDPVSGLLEVERRPGGGIECQNTGAADDGLYINVSSLGITGSTEPTTVTSITGGNTIHVAVRKSTAACNGIRLDGDGVYAHCPDSIVQTMNISPSFTPFGINSAGAGTFAIPSTCNDSCSGTFWHICNTLCCQVAGFISGRVYGGAVSGASVGFDAYAYIELNTGAGFTGVSPPVFLRMQNLNGSQNYWDISNQEERNYLVLNPGECIDFQLQQVIHVVAGTATWATGPNFEYYVHLTQTGCC